MAVMSGKAIDQQTLDELYAHWERERREALQHPINTFQFNSQEDAVLKAAKALWDSPGHCVVSGTNIYATWEKTGFWMDARIWISHEDVENHQDNTGPSKPPEADMPF